MGDVYMNFTKMHGIGNDYIYINCFTETVTDPEKVSVILSDVRKGIGSDGLVLIMPSDIADFRMRIFNADGSEAMMCGNATRCIGKYVYEKGLTDKTDITLETNSGIKYLTLAVKSGKVSSVTVDMGKAVLLPKDIPVDSPLDRFIAQPVEAGGRSYDITCVSMGNPHAVLFMDDIDSLDLEQIGFFGFRYDARSGSCLRISPGSTDKYVHPGTARIPVRSRSPAEVLPDIPFLPVREAPLPAPGSSADRRTPFRP